MATVEGSPYGPGEHPVLGGAIQFHDTGVVMEVSSPRNPRTPAQQNHRQRLLTVDDFIKRAGTLPIDIIQNIAPVTARWHQWFVRKVLSHHDVLYLEAQGLFEAFSGSARAAWQVEGELSGLGSVRVRKATDAQPSAGLSMFVFAWSCYHGPDDFGTSNGEPGTGNAGAWGTFHRSDI